ncbi:DUF302 domain-containing protein [Natronoflexus pectinivorans]|uniref:Uncharacterized protein DUF302 n=1 Tax=Natronoflexus pectinivorans TaxID=682526 RepID=A0A4R2GFV0_9BACT|nr:DUF302 domain-containing protein [Natronoflexus pectinivorans]TCO07072.1 uncharacterized protein DUF302 [Natronoflexus pectinivorans]
MKIHKFKWSGLLLLIIILFSACRAETDTAVISERESLYGFDETVELIRQNALDAGWTIPIVHDMQLNLQNAGVAILPAKIIELCNAGHAAELLQADRTKFNLAVLPCRVAIYQKEDGKTYVSWKDYALFSHLEHSISKPAFRLIQADMEEIISPVFN